MLVLSRKVGESILIGDDIVVKIVSKKNGRVRLAIEAPASTKVLRKELVVNDKHEWVGGDSYQWGNARGGRPGDAATPYQCRKCGARFVHRYNEEPSLYQAIKDEGLDNDCPAGEGDD